MLTATLFACLKDSCYFCKQIVYNMNNRLQQFLSAENISQSQFSDKLGVARASVSHILSGRNRPGFDFMERMARLYPNLNLEWFITGKGKMYKSNNEQVAPRLWEDDDEPENSGSNIEEDVKEVPIIKSSSLYNKAKSIENQRTISKIVVFYNDNTFTELK